MTTVPHQTIGARRAAIVALGLAGCGRIGFDVEAASPACRFDEPWTLTTPEPLSEIDALLLAAFPNQPARSEFDPVFSADGLTLFFTSDQQGNGWSVWQATRPALDQPFDHVARLGDDINLVLKTAFGFQPIQSGPARDVALISADYTGTIGSLDLWRGTRDPATGRYAWLATALSTTVEDLDARLTDDGLGVYVVRQGPNGDEEIELATRAALADDFGAPSPIDTIDTSSDDSAPSPVAGGNALWLVSDRPGGFGSNDIYVATRASPELPWDPPLLAPAINGSSKDGEPGLFVGPTTCELVFTSDRTGPNNLYHAFVVTP